MAAPSTLPQLPNSSKSQISKTGVLTLSGFGISVRVQRGHLEIEDGVGTERRTIKLPRVGHGLKRLTVIGSDGLVTLSALEWLSAQDIAFVMLERNGKVLCVTGPVRPSDAKLRRAQSLAAGNGLGLEIARTLIDVKLEGQERVLRERLNCQPAAEVISDFRDTLLSANTFESIRTVEANSAAAYFREWRYLPVTWPNADLPRIPDHWRFAGSRQSPLSGGPRLAVTPVHAILNYCFALLESETRLALAALGLDPGLGVGLHTDTANRDSFALDVLEPIRPQVEAWLLGWITTEPLRRADFFETETGNCRLMSQMCTKLSETTSVWGKMVSPWAEWVRQAFWNSIRKSTGEDHSLPTRLTQRRRSEGRGKEFFLNVEPPPIPERICHGCGATTRRGRHCPKCGREISKEKLIELAKLGRVAAQHPESRKRHSETQRRHEAAKRAWRSSPKPAWIDDERCLEEIRLRLAGVTISTLSSILGVSESYAADIRAGRHRPHPRHWLALARLVDLPAKRP